MPGTWRDGDDDGEDAPPVPPVHPDDRLWRHPSEISWQRPVSGTMPIGAGAGEGHRSASRLWTLALTSGLTGAALAVGIVALTVGIGERSPERAFERSDPRDQLASATGGATTADDLVAMAGTVTASIVRLEIETPGGAVSGSGVVLHDDGHLVTSAALLEGATSVTIVLADGETVPAHVVGSDAPTDVAVVAPDDPGDRRWVPADRGSTDDLAMGEPAMAVGSSGGAGVDPVSIGVISAIGRQASTVTGRVLHGMVQTDAPIAADIAGGALCDGAGRVIGIVTSTGSGDLVSPGFATPVETAWTVAETLMSDGAVPHVWLGIEGSDLDATQSSIQGITGTGAGAMVERVLPEGPAAEAGLLGGDAITAIDGRRLTSMSDLVVALRRYEPGEEIILTIHRGGQVREIDVTLAERED